MRKLQFQYHALKVIVSVDGTQLSYKIGLSSKQLSLSRVQQFYVATHPSLATQELLVRHGDDSKSRLERIHSDPDQTDFQTLVDLLAERCPQADLRSLSQAEAMQRLGSGDTTKRAAVSVAAVVAAVVAAALAYSYRSGDVDPTTLAIAAGVSVCVIAGMLIYTIKPGKPAS